MPLSLISSITEKIPLIIRRLTVITTLDTLSKDANKYCYINNLDNIFILCQVDVLPINF